MTPSSARSGARKYSYYRCSRQLKQGKAACPAKHVSAPKIEAEVVARIAEIGRDPALVDQVVRSAQEQVAEKRRALAEEKRAIEKAVREAEKERVALAGQAADPGEPGRRAREALDRLDARTGEYGARRDEIAREREGLVGAELDPGDVARALREFDELWSVLLPREQRRVVELMVERVALGENGGPTVTLRPTGIEALTREVAG